MKKEKLFRFFIAIVLLRAIVINGWLGIILFVSIYVAGRITTKMVCSKAKDSATVLEYFLMACVLFSVILCGILQDGSLPLIIMATWLISTVWRTNIMKGYFQTE